MLVPTNLRWTPAVPWVRVVLAAAVLGATWLLGVRWLSPFSLLLGLYLAAGFVIAVGGRGTTGMLSLLALFGDTVYFLIVASYGTDRLFWPACVVFLCILIEALLFHGPVETAIVAGVSVVFCAVFPYPPIRRLEPTLVVSGILACGFAANRRRQSATAEELRAKLARTEKAVTLAREEESQRIASDFHDGPLQSFISLQMRLEVLRKLLERDFDAGMQDLKQLQSLAQAQVRDLRTFLHSMRPVDVDGGNLLATARRAAEAFQKESGIPVTFMGGTTPMGLPPEMSLEVLQIVREALHNVQKHANATRVAVAVEKSDRGLEISVDDNGHGFNFAGTYSLEELELLRLGPASLKRRARSLNAEMLLESRPGRGSGIKFRIPLQ